MFRELADEGCVWVQVDEPCLALDLSERARVAFALAYGFLARDRTPDLLLASYFGPIGDNLPTALRLPVAGLHFDLVRGSSDLEPVLEEARPDLWLSLGLVDGRNVWRTDLRAALAVARRVEAARGGTRRLIVAPSCSLLHVPVELADEDRLDREIRPWLAFAHEKLDEVAALARGLDEGDGAIAGALDVSDAAFASPRASPFPERRRAQQARLRLPLFPTTTIGSFLQTPKVRQARAALGRGQLGQDGYDERIGGWIADAIRWQEGVGLDVLVHGEFERNDMVRYFGGQLDGFAFTRHGWVQSYGSRCVAPPIIWGGVARPAPMTVRWTTHAQSLTASPVKGMLTGPITILQWSFVRG